MSVKIITGVDGEQVLYCSTTMQAFGAVHEDENFDLQDFLEWLPEDARKYDQDVLNTKYYEWLKEKQEEKAFDQWDGGYEGDGVFAPNH
jgi:hypothetical protein